MFKKNVVSLRRKTQTYTIMANYGSYSEKELNARVALSEIQMMEGKTHSHNDVMVTLQKRTIQTE